MQGSERRKAAAGTQASRVPYRPRAGTWASAHWSGLAFCAASAALLALLLGSMSP
jgi:hypothetical protein